MSRYAAYMGVIALALGMSPSAWGGYYTSFDTLAETQRYGRDHRDFQLFSNEVTDLAAIAPNEYPRFVPIRQRYLLLEALGGDNPMQLKTLGQKLDYSAVLIRRGRYEDAVQLLVPLVDENPKNFLVLSHCATAHFLASRDFQRKAAFYMKRALVNWPTNWKDVTEDQRKFLATRGWDETDFDRYRRCEVLFDRLVRNRLEEEKKLAQKKPVTEEVDPVFTEDADKPIRFVNEAGVFEPGRIAKAEYDKLPRDALEAVEQLMIWMPHDRRLEWLLGEVFNASAMERGLTADERNDRIRIANRIFEKMTDPLSSVKFGLSEIRSRHEKLREAVAAMPPRAIPNELKELLKKDDEENKPPSPDQLWRYLIVAFLSGLAVGLFLLWQYQEMRRRRQARA